MNYKHSRLKLISQLCKIGISNPIVLNAMSIVPRHCFVPKIYQSQAYENEALPLSAGQTISQPYVVAKMTELLLGSKKKLHKVLEIGTGSGYQAAILSQIADEVYTIERIESLVTQVKTLFNSLEYLNIFSKYGDGRIGWEDKAPFDGIIVTAAVPFIEKAWMNQLALGARLVVPLCNKEGEGQILDVVERNEQGDYSNCFADRVVFVPLKPGKA